MNELYLSELIIYPVKSLGGISLTQALLEERGLQYDRRWMLIDEEGTFISQRKYHELALLQVCLIKDNLVITHKHHPDQTISFSIEAYTSQSITVSVWDDQSSGLEVSTSVSQWFSEFLNTRVRLVKMPENEKRQIDQRYASPGEIVSFADGYPCLLISQASLDGLNKRLDQSIMMDRFRPNFVFTGTIPHIEDSFDTFHIGEILFKVVKPCSRCIMVTIDQQTAAKSSEPLKTLAGYRKNGNKILFGQNLIHTGTGIIRIGDQIKVKTFKPIT